MRILTANIALGLRDMDHLWNNMRGIAAYHSWFAFTGIVFPFLRGKGKGAPYSPRRVEYLRTHKDLGPLFRMLTEVDPDIVVLNEVTPEVHGPELETRLHAMGFSTITFGRGGKYPDAYVSTYIATKAVGEPIEVEMPQPHLPGCGGGVAGLRLASGISIIGAHMAFGGSELWREQIRSFAAVAETEKEKGNEIILAGDWNETDGPIMSQPEFRRLHLKSVDTPSFLLRFARTHFRDVCSGRTLSPQRYS